MSVINNVILVGRLTADPEVRQGENSSYGRATVAVQRDFKNKEGQDWIGIIENNYKEIIMFLYECEMR